MNLCLACRDVGPAVYGGLPRATSELALGLAKAGHSVHLLTEPSLQPPPELAGVSIVGLPLYEAPGPFKDAAPESAAGNLLRAAAVHREVCRVHENEQPVDAVIAPLWRSEGVVCALDERFPTIISCITGLKIVTELDGSYRRLPDVKQRLLLEHEALVRSRYLHGLTDTTLRKTIRDFGLYPAVSGVVGRGLHDRHRPETVDDRRHEAVRVLFIGRLERRKGVDVLLSAARLLVEEGLDVSFTFVGPELDPAIRAGFEREAGDGPWRRAVRFTGAVPDAVLDRFLAETDIVCLPSRYESHGIALIEAMMFGKAIVTCDAGGIREVVNPERNALLCPPEDPASLAATLARLLRDRRLCVTLGAAARETYERRFDIGVVADQMGRFIERVLEAHHASASDVSGRLATLIRDVGAAAPEECGGLAAALLDPAHPTLERLREWAPARAPRGRNGSRPAPDVTAVLVTHDRPTLLRRALDSVESSTVQIRTIVVDNGSRDYAARQIAADCAGRPDVDLHRLPQNLGAAAGRRHGVGFVGDGRVLLLDDDAELLPDTVEQLVAELDAHPSTGAVTATVLTPDGTVHHSGGSLQVDEGVATFGLVGSGIRFEPDALPPSGPAEWVPSTAVLVCRDLLQEHPFDDRMAAYFEDNEWSYRVWRQRPDGFRRSREALTVHRLTDRGRHDMSARARSFAVGQLTGCARFYELHGLLLGPWLFHTVPELCASDGSCDLPGARVLMELIAAKGPGWTLAAWNDGRLWGVLNAHRIETQLKESETALARAGEQLAYLQERDLTLCRIEQGGWWRLHGRVLPLIGAAQRLRAHAGRRRRRRPEPPNAT